MHLRTRQALIAGLGLAVALAGAPAPGRAAAGSGLRARAEREGAVRVIVHLAEPGGTGRRSFGAPLRASSIGLRQERLLAALPAAGDRRPRRFRRVPFLALDVDAVALAALERSSLVASIEEDRLLAPALAQSVPLIGADLAHADGTTGSDWSVAILDTGVDGAHPFLAGRVVSEAC